VAWGLRWDELTLLLMICLHWLFDGCVRMIVGAQVGPIRTACRRRAPDEGVLETDGHVCVARGTIGTCQARFYVPVACDGQSQHDAGSMRK